LKQIVEGGYTGTLRYLRENEPFGKAFASDESHVVRQLRIRVGEITFLDEV